MIGEISAALGGINAAVQIGKSLVGAHTDVKVNQEISKMLDAVLEAKVGLLEASETIGKLQEELRQAQSKLAAIEDLSRYEYTTLDTGAVVVRITAGSEKSKQEADAKFCPKCFEDKTVRILQTENEDSYFRCNTCDGIFLRDNREDEAVQRSRNSTTGY